MATGLTSEARAERKRLQVIERNLGQTERALDQVLDLLRPGAERRADRRTRSAAAAVGEARLAAVRRVVLEEAPELADRIRVVRSRFNDKAGDERGRVRAALSTKKGH